jgi:hypothetical protein
MRADSVFAADRLVAAPGRGKKAFPYLAASVSMDLRAAALAVS